MSTLAETHDDRRRVTLASPAAIVRTYFWPLYPDDVRENLERARATDVNPVGNPSLLAHLEDAARIFAGSSTRLFGEDMRLDFSDASVHRISRAITRERIEAWASHGEAGTPENELFNVVVHGAAYVGACVVKNHEGSWSMRRPLWESVVRLSSRLGEGDLHLFSWWLKSIASVVAAGTTAATRAQGEGDGGIFGHTLADRYRAHVENPRARPEELPVLVPEGRRLPRLQKPRYDLFYKYLKAHLPEVKDVGKDFPSPERFEELGFAWLDFVPVGRGRMLLLAGPNKNGMHLFWLDGSGFQKGAFYPADSFPESVLKATPEADVIQVVVSVDKEMVVHETLWWGP